MILSVSANTCAVAIAILHATSGYFLSRQAKALWDIIEAENSGSITLIPTTPCVVMICVPSKISICTTNTTVFVSTRGSR